MRLYVQGAGRSGRQAWPEQDETQAVFADHSVHSDMQAKVDAIVEQAPAGPAVVVAHSLGAVVAGALGMAFVGVSSWQWPSALWLLPIGFLAVLGQLCMTRAYASGATLVVANLQYSGIVFAGIYSLTVFGDRLPFVGWLGMALIIASGVTATWLRARAVPDAPAEEH